MRHPGISAWVRIMARVKTEDEHTHASLPLPRDPVANAGTAPGLGSVVGEKLKSGQPLDGVGVVARPDTRRQGPTVPT